jgi:hypothetical protein
MTAKPTANRLECLNSLPTPRWRIVPPETARGRLSAAAAFVMTAHREQTFQTARAVSRKQKSYLLGFEITGRL